MPDRRLNFLSAVKEVFGNKKFRPDPRTVYSFFAFGFAGIAAYSAFSPSAPAFFASLSSTMAAQEVLAASSAASLWCVVSCGQCSHSSDRVYSAKDEVEGLLCDYKPTKKPLTLPPRRPVKPVRHARFAVEENSSTLH